MPGHRVVSAEKRRLRAALRALRRSLPPAQRAAEVAAACAACLRLVGDAACASYAALPDELDLDGLHRALWAAGRGVLLPRVSGAAALAWHRVSGPDQLVPGAYGIREPDPRRAPAAELPPSAALLVPGVGFDRGGRRLGQGGGFYDRLLAARPDLRGIGVGFACQLVPAVPVEVHDLPLRGLVIAGEVVLAPDPT